MIRIKLDWKAIWDELDLWVEQKEEAGRCKTCGYTCFPEWEDEKRKIVRIVNAHIRKAVSECQRRNEEG